MQKSPTEQRGGGGLSALVGIALFTIGGMVLEDAMGGDVLTIIGFLCIASGLVGIIAGAVRLGVQD